MFYFYTPWKASENRIEAERCGTLSARNVVSYFQSPNLFYLIQYYR